MILTRTLTQRFHTAVLKHLDEQPLTGDAVVDVAGIVPVVETSMDGTSGALFSIFLNALVHSLREAGTAAGGDAAVGGGA